MSTKTKNFEFGKVAWYGNKKINMVDATVELRDTDKGYVLSATCTVWNSKHTDCVAGGQAFDDIKICLKKSGIKSDTFDFIYDMWSKYHLNNCHAGTVEQEDAIKMAKEMGVLSKNSGYDVVCDYLKEIGLYEVEYEGKPYRYGSSWLFREIPKDDLDKIIALVS